MGALTRSYNWEQTSLGPADKWPQSLRTTVSIILNSKFPMFLFWGSDALCFYNDAYRPSLGNEGKHPFALGQPGAEVWPEIWATIKPLMDQVLSGGEATWSEDQLLPIYRNGKMEDVYWTFSYSPVSDESGRPAGVFVTCMETTETVTGRKKIEESEERFRRLADQVPQFIWMTGNTGIAVTYINKPFLDFLGLKHYTEFLGSTWEALMHPGDIQHVYEVYGAAFAARQPYRLEARYKQGGSATYRWFLLQGVPRYEADGIFAGFIGTGIDINESKEAEEALKLSEAKFRSLIEEAPVATCLFAGRDMVIEIANQRMIDVWGKGPGVLGMPLAQALPELAGQPFLSLLDDLFTTGSTYEAKEGLAHLEVNGILGTYYFNYTFKPVRNTAGEVYAILEMAEDVTTQVLSKRALEESEQNLRNIILQAPVAMCILRGPHYVVEIANERMFALWGKLPDEVIGKPVFAGIPEAKEQGLEPLLYNVYTVGEPVKAYERPLNLLRAGKIETTYVNFVYEPLYESAGVISGVLAVAVEVTEQVLARHKIEEVVAQRTAELAEANKALQLNNHELEQFAYIASHDLQEPLRKVSTFTEMLKTSLGDVDHRSKTYLEKISAASGRMLQLIRDVLNFSQLSKDRDVFKPVDLTVVLDTIVTDFELLIEQKGAALHYKKLPVIDAIPLQMQQLFCNLVSNALKFTREDVAPVITITAGPLPEAANGTYPNLLPDADYLLITVADNGIGFHQEHAAQIFGIFQRLHGRSEYAGTGIGLALCKKIVQNHHGEIWATADKDTGSVFHIILPQTAAGRVLQLNG